MRESDLLWHEKSRKQVYSCRVLAVNELTSVSPTGDEGEYTLLDLPDFAIVVPLLYGADGEKTAVMVKQWRHGAGRLSVEFPGGVLEKGEEPEIGARRELKEETGYCAGKMTFLGKLSPNPAIMNNMFYVFLAEDLENTERLNLDKDEFLQVTTVPLSSVIQNMGEPPFINGIIAAALSLYSKYSNSAP